LRSSTARKQAGQKQVASVAAGIGNSGSSVHQQSAPGLHTNIAPHRLQRVFVSGFSLAGISKAFEL